MISKKVRTIISGLFILAFLITAPLLILYTSGYRYSFKKQEISKSGSLVLETEPKSATVYLNNDTKSHQTPLRLTDLFPNDYRITVSKDGYYPWKKTLSVDTQKTTFAEDIILFKQSEPVHLVDDTIMNPILAPNKKFVQYLSENDGQTSVNILDLNAELFTTPLVSDDSKYKIESIDWSDEGRFLSIIAMDTINSQRFFTVISVTDDEMSFDETTNIDFSEDSQLRWSNDQDALLYVLNGEQLDQYSVAFGDLQSQPVFTFVPGTIVEDFLVNQNSIYYVTKDEETSLLTKRSVPADPNELTSQIELSESEYSLLELIDDKLVLQEDSSKKTFFVNDKLDNVLLEQDALLGYSIQAKDKRLLLHDDAEIKTTDFRSYPFTFETVTRLSGGIVSADWYAVPNYVVYLKDGVISIIELDKRDIKNLLHLPAENVTFVAIGTRGEKIFYTHSDKPGLYSLHIAD